MGIIELITPPRFKLLVNCVEKTLDKPTVYFVQGPRGSGKKQFVYDEIERLGIRPDDVFWLGFDHSSLNGVFGVGSSIHDFCKSKVVVFGDDFFTNMSRSHLMDLVTLTSGLPLVCKDMGESYIQVDSKVVFIVSQVNPWDLGENPKCCDPELFALKQNITRWIKSTDPILQQVFLTKWTENSARAAKDIPESSSELESEDDQDSESEDLAPEINLESFPECPLEPVMASQVDQTSEPTLNQEPKTAIKQEAYLKRRVALLERLLTAVLKA